MTMAEMQAHFRDAVLSTMEELGFDAQTLKACLFTAAGLEFERVLLAKLDPEVVQYLGHSPLFKVTVQ